jgi:hypothetical protein
MSKQSAEAPQIWKRQSIQTVTAILMLLFGVGSPAAAQGQRLPNPILYLTGTELYSTGGKTFVRHKYDVFNKEAFPAALFAPAPALPPCGSNTKSSRTWVDFFDSRGKRLYGFCALGTPADLGSIWFATVAGETPPSYIYIEINDRQTNMRYKSNLADTTP